MVDMITPNDTKSSDPEALKPSGPKSRLYTHHFPEVGICVVEYAPDVDKPERGIGVSIVNPSPDANGVRDVYTKKEGRTFAIVRAYAAIHGPVATLEPAGDEEVDRAANQLQSESILSLVRDDRLSYKNPNPLALERARSLLIETRMLTNALSMRDRVKSSRMGPFALPAFVNLRDLRDQFKRELRKHLIATVVKPGPKPVSFDKRPKLTPDLPMLVAKHPIERDSNPVPTPAVTKFAITVKRSPTLWDNIVARFLSVFGRKR